MLCDRRHLFEPSAMSRSAPDLRAPVMLNTSSPILSTAEPVALGCLPKRKTCARQWRQEVTQVAGEHAPAATDRAKSFQADDEGSNPFTRSIFKIKHLSRIMRELRGAFSATVSTISLGAFASELPFH